MANRPFAIFYIDTNKAYFYGSNIPSMLSVDIPADTMSYFDILNKDKFYQIIQTVVTNNKIEPVQLLILISPQATYEKDLATKSAQEITTQTQQFIDAVPFDKVLSRAYKIQDTTKVVATNKDLYEYIRHGFEKMQFSTTAVVSLSLLQKIMPELGTSLNLETIASKFDAIKQYSYITHEEINNPAKPNQQEEDSNKPNPMRLYGLIGVFVVLIGVLAFMVYTTMQPQPKPVVRQTIQQTQPIIVTPTTIVSQTPLLRTNESTSSGKTITPSVTTTLRK